MRRGHFFLVCIGAMLCGAANVGASQDSLNWTTAQESVFWLGFGLLAYGGAAAFWESW